MIIYKNPNIEKELDRAIKNEKSYEEIKKNTSKINAKNAA